MNKLVKTLLAYYSPYFLFLAYSLYTSPAEANRLQAGLLGRIFSVYWIAGLLIVPLLAFGLPSAALIRAEVFSPRIREALRSKLLVTAISLGLVLVMVLTVRLVPPQNLTSLIFDVVVFLTTLCLLIWMRFGRRSG
jgi:hypothetical protein